MSYRSPKTRFLLFCPGCTPEWTTILLLSPGVILLVWFSEHTGTTFSRQNSYWVLKLFFFGGKNFFFNWGHRLLCIATVWEYTPGLTLGTKVSSKSSAIVIRNPLQISVDFFCECHWRPFIVSPLAIATFLSPYPSLVFLYKLYLGLYSWRCVC